MNEILKNKYQQYEFKNKIGQDVLAEYNQINSKNYLFINVVIVLTALLGVFAVAIGPMDISIRDVWQVIMSKVFPNTFEAPEAYIDRTIWLIRIPRYLTAVLVGSALAISGAIMQPVLRNPMASPFTLGISSGAGFGAALAIIMGISFGQGPYAVVINAFIFAILTALIIMAVSKKNDASPEMMILTGIALSYFFNACITILQVFAEPWAVSEVVFWMVGSLSKGTWENLTIIFSVMIFAIPYLMIKSLDLNSISAGDESAKSMGVNVERTRIILMLVASLVTSTAICFTGTIGFVGLVAPHITRMLVGGDNRFVVPVSGLVGAFLLVVSDLVAMNILAPLVLPIGIMTSFIGVPLFIYLILKGRSAC